MSPKSTAITDPAPGASRPKLPGEPIAGSAAAKHDVVSPTDAASAGARPGLPAESAVGFAEVKPETVLGPATSPELKLETHQRQRTKLAQRAKISPETNSNLFLLFSSSSSLPPLLSFLSSPTNCSEANDQGAEAARETFSRDQTTDSSKAKQQRDTASANLPQEPPATSQKANKESDGMRLCKRESIAWTTTN
ncbi:hypothetical protein VTK56DRAFT_2064 [Thermocarpiscus australiensis]